MYKVIVSFSDMQDNNYEYKVNDTYPRKGFDVLPSRIKELSSKANRRGIALIKEVEEEPKPKKSTKKTEKKID